MALAGSPQLTSGEVEAYRANIWKIYVFRFFLNFQFWWPIWVIYLTDLRGLSFTQVAILEAPFFLSMVLIQVPAGIFADRHGRKLTMCIGTVLSAVSILAFGTANSYLLILGTYVVWAWSLAILQAADSAFMYDNLKALGEEDRFREVMGKSTAIFNMAIVASLLIGAPLADAIGLDRAVQLSALSSLVALGVGLTLREPARIAPAERPAVRDFVRQTYVLGRSDVRIPLLMVLYGFLGVGSIATAVFFQPFLDGHGVSVGDVGYLQAPARVFGALGAISAFWLARKAGEMRSLYIIAGSATGAYVVLGLWDSIGAFVMFPVISMVSAASIPIVADMLNRRIPSEQRATVLSSGQLTLALVMAGFSPLLGSIADAYSLTVGFLAGGVVIGTGSLLALVALGAGSQL
ncbi:MAG TPA: MFS transporter, partial [Propionibacteriaceae bacterium]|nr:MFS transporter [Propionibacteriaceae bacterium]